MTEITIYLSIITLNSNGLNSPVKRNRLQLWVRKQNPSSCHLQERHLTSKDKDWGETMEGSTPSLCCQETSRCDYTTSGETDFEEKLIRRHQEDHYILNKGKIHQEDFVVLNTNPPSRGALNLVEQILTDVKITEELQ